MQDFIPFKHQGGPRWPPNTRLIFLPPILKILPPIQNSTDNTDSRTNFVTLTSQIDILALLQHQ
jgi:hypothetical protein